MEVLIKNKELLCHCLYCRATVMFELVKCKSLTLLLRDNIKNRKSIHFDVASTCLINCQEVLLF